MTGNRLGNCFGTLGRISMLSRIPSPRFHTLQLSNLESVASWSTLPWHCASATHASWLAAHVGPALTSCSFNICPLFLPTCSGTARSLTGVSLWWDWFANVRGEQKYAQDIWWCSAPRRMVLFGAIAARAIGELTVSLHKVGERMFMLDGETKALASDCTCPVHFSETITHIRTPPAAEQTSHSQRPNAFPAPFV